MFLSSASKLNIVKVCDTSDSHSQQTFYKVVSSEYVRGISIGSVSASKLYSLVQYVSLSVVLSLHRSVIANTSCL